MKKQVPVGADAHVATDDDGTLHGVTPDVAYQRLGIVNVIFIDAGSRGDTSGGDQDPPPDEADAPERERRRWTLVDAGIPASGTTILSAVERRYGADARPDAIVLTHGHFDHVGALVQLAERWDVPIYAHPLERPYLDGTRSYPQPDPSVGGGLMARAAKLYPKDPVDVSRWLSSLPEDGLVPTLPGWRWIHTPGHTPGHVSLWRENDRTLIAGDAVITTDQESAYAVAVQRPELHGPPMYFTPDWDAARSSAERLAALRPERIVSGHGPPLEGPEMRRALDVLARDFDEVAVPERGRYVASARPEA